MAAIRAEPNQTPGRSKRQRPAGGLYLVATPIGNLRDITLRALDLLTDADVVACEDSRVTRKLLSAYGIQRRLTTYHEHNAERVRPRLVARLREGKSLALVSDAGTPLVSDPGYKLVQAAIEAGLPVTTVPGPSAVLAALTLSGLPTERFLFAGFLSSRAA
ncbi:MAG: 16S rRNA (cytidine(1402)-2'-O)-methyltransferase, partial [Kiloniellales bacterium]